MPGPEVTVLVVDDQRPFRTAARAVIARTSGFSVVGEAATGEEAIDAVRALHPSLVLMDINLPGIDGIEATRQILTETPGTIVFLCSTYQERDLPAGAATSGAAGYIDKEEFGPALLERLWGEHTPV